MLIKETLSWQTSITLQSTLTDIGRFNITLYILYVACIDCANDKIPLRSHSSLSWFSKTHVWTVRTTKYKLFKFCTSCVQTVSVEGSMKQGKKGLDDEENVTDVREELMKKDKQGL